MNVPLYLQSKVAAALRPVGLYHPLRDLRRSRRFRSRSRKQLADWVAAGRPVPPPPAIKHAVLRRYARTFQTRTLVETGTFYGDTLFELRHEFAAMHSIELAPELHQLAKKELGHVRHLQLHFGDSADVLPKLLPALAGPTLFWLDGHFCAGPSARGKSDTPIAAEVQSILARPPARDVVLIDDARLFTGRDDYPTLDEIRTHVAQLRPGAVFAVEDDIICLAPV